MVRWLKAAATLPEDPQICSQYPGVMTHNYLQLQLQEI